MHVDDHFEVLAANCLAADQALGGIWEPCIEILTAHSPATLFAAGQRIISGDAKLDTAFVLVQGSVAMLCADGCEASIKVAPGEPPRIFGTLAILADSPFFCDVEALDKCSFYLIREERLQRFLLEHPQERALITDALNRFYRSSLKTLARGSHT